MDDIFSSSTGTMNNIYLNRDSVTSTYGKIKDCSSNIESDVNNIKSLIEDLKTYWIGSESTKFVKALSEYSEFFIQCAKAYQISSENLKQCLDNYLEVDNEYSKEID